MIMFQTPTFEFVIDKQPIYEIIKNKAIYYISNFKKIRKKFYI